MARLEFIGDNQTSNGIGERVAHSLQQRNSVSMAVTRSIALISSALALIGSGDPGSGTAQRRSEADAQQKRSPVDPAIRNHGAPIEDHGVCLAGEPCLEQSEFQGAEACLAGDFIENCSADGPNASLGGAPPSPSLYRARKFVEVGSDRSGRLMSRVIPRRRIGKVRAAATIPRGNPISMN